MSDQIADLKRHLADLEKQLEEARARASQLQTELARKQHQLDLLIDLGAITAGTESAFKALDHVLQFICKHMDWPVGHVLLHDPHQSDHMISSEIWFSCLPEGIRDFQKASRRFRVQADSGLIGAALASGKPAWASQLEVAEPSARNKSAATHGLGHALACPIQVNQKTHAILEFYSKRPIPQDAATKETIRQFSVHLARLFELQHATEVRALYSEQLERNAEQLSRMAHIGSHDLQEPLRKIELFMTRLRQTDGGSLSERGRQSLEKMTAASTRMSALIRDLLELMYVATDQWTLSEVNLNLVLARIRDIRVRRELNPEDQLLTEPLPMIWSEPAVTQQVFEELIDNAIQYRGANRPLNIQVSHRDLEDEHFEIRVQDNGIGFQPEYAEQIFTPFQILKRNQSEQNTGVGLAICRRAIERLGGSLTAHSDGTNQGASFRIRLPQSVIVQNRESGAAPPLFRSSQQDEKPD